MKLDSFSVYRGFDGEYAGRIKVYVAELIVEVPLQPKEAESLFKHAEADLTGAHERAKTLVREAAR